MTAQLLAASAACVLTGAALLGFAELLIAIGVLLMLIVVDLRRP